MNTTTTHTPTAGMGERAAVQSWSIPYLAQALLNGAARQGDWSRFAAVRLIVDHEEWLHRRVFRQFVRSDGEGYAYLDLALMATAIDISPLFGGSSSETAILRLACSLTGNVPHGRQPLIADRWSLKAILRPLDSYHAALAAAAVDYAALGPSRGVR